METNYYLQIKADLVTEGYEDEINWQTNLQLCTDPITFRNESIWVILNSGMKAQIARLIHTRIWQAKNDGRDISTVFNHKGKVAAIKLIMTDYQRMFDEYTVSLDRLAYLKTVPFIGDITKYHLAKNLGTDCVKPDRHLVRIAKKYGYLDCNMLCNKLSQETGDKVSVVDIVLWRAANLGWI